MSTSVVTGGAGFLGSHLCERLLAAGQRVICIDNLDTGTLENIEHLRDGDFEFVQHDITEFVEIAEEVDFIYHLASPASPIDYLRLPLHTLKVGSYGTHHMLGVAKLKRARFLLASTSEVYGDPKVHPQSEAYWGNVNPIGPRGVYDEAKRYAEALTMAYHRQQGVDTCISRTFNSYGSQDEGPRRPGDPDLPAPGADRTSRSPSSATAARRAASATSMTRSAASSPWPSRTSTSRSTSATRTSSPCCSLPRRSRRSPGRARRSSSPLCPSTTPRSASRTSAAPGSCSAGSRRSVSPMVCG